MHRRDFIKKSAVAGVTGSAIINGLYMNNLFESSTGVPMRIDIPSPYLNKLIVKPIITGMYHTDIWEGPCRFSVAPMEEEKKAAIKSYENFRNTIKNSAFDKSTVDFLEPAHILFVEDFKIAEEEFKKIDDDSKKADVLYINPEGSSIAAYDIARRYNKPVVLSMGINCRTVDISAYCRSKGLECYIPNSLEETNQLFTLLKARKNFSQTRILYPTNWGWPSVASVAGINEPGKLKEQFGIEVITISYDELSKEMDRTKGDKTLEPDAAEMADTMYKNADRSFIDKKYIVNSMEFYQTIVNLMKKHNCNAFTIECFEFCTSRLPQKWNITPCLIHTMFKDLGIPSACEGDLGGLLAMHVLMLLSNKSPHLGNMFYQQNGKGVLTINHSVPGIKMNGFDKPGLPYQLAHFVESGWGTKAVVDFMNNETKEVTVARMNPAGTGILVLKGTLVSSKGWGEDQLGCYDIADIVGKESGTAEEFVRKQADYGNHLPWVYGDYSEQIKKLGELIGFDVVVVS
jgi:L-fucose isomerase-like protein